MTASDGTSPDSQARAGAPRDPFLWVGFVVWGLSIFPSLIPVLSPEQTFTWADQYSDAPPLALVLLAAALQVGRAHRQRERIFWRLVVGCLLGWLAVRGLYLVVPYDYWGTGLDLASDVLYLGGYLCLALALERRPDRSPATGAQAKVKRVESLGTLIFAFGLLTYFVLIPSIFNPEIYASWVSSLLLYAVLDAYLLVRALTLLGGGLEPGWTPAMRWIAVTFAFWFLGDFLEGLMYLEAIPWVDPGSPLDIIWHVPALTLLLAVRSRWKHVDDPIPEPDRALA